MIRNLLIVDDEPDVRKVLRVTLSAADYRVMEATSGEEALDLLDANGFDLVLLDSNLPGLSGRSVCREIRRRGHDVPILMLTVRDTEQDKIDAFSTGADDYVTKPFATGELTARIHALIRRAQHAFIADQKIVCGLLTLVPDQLAVVTQGNTLKLTPTQYKILEVLAQADGKVVPYRKLLSNVWGAGCSDRTEYLRVFIRQLRVLLEEDPARPQTLVTEQHIGYRLRDVRGDIGHTNILCSGSC